MTLLDVLNLLSKKQLDKVEAISYEDSPDSFKLDFCIEDEFYDFFIFSIYLYHDSYGKNKYDNSSLSIKMDEKGNEVSVNCEALKLYEEISEIWYKNVISKEDKNEHKK